MSLGEFIELKELLIDTNHTSTPQQPANNREIQEPLSCVLCYLYYIATATYDPLTRDTAVYGQIVIQKHGSTGWQAYNRLFCLQKASNASILWSAHH